MMNNKFTNIIGIVAVFSIVYMVISFINKRTEAKLNSEEAINDLNDPKKVAKLNDAIEDYYKNNGVWDEKMLNAI